MYTLRAWMNPAQGFSYQFYFFDKDTGLVTEDMIFKKVEPGVFMRPAFELEKAACQGLMDSLWQLGFRPSEGVSSTGQVEAMQAHLSDMRKLAFGLLTHELYYPGANDGKETVR